MIKHIVVWTMKPEVTDAQKLEMKRRLEALGPKIAGLIRIEAGIDGGNHTMSLYSEFAAAEDLERYQAHPEHQSVAAFIKPLTAERRVCDYPA